MQDHSKLLVFNKAHQVVLCVYDISRKLPSIEKYHLANQIRRSASSIPINIVEGCGRKTDRDKAHFFQIAHASASELAYQLFLIKDLGYISEEQFTELNPKALEVKKMLNSLIKKLWRQIECS